MSDGSTLKTYLFKIHNFLLRIYLIHFWEKPFRVFAMNYAGWLPKYFLSLWSLFMASRFVPDILNGFFTIQNIS